MSDETELIRERGTCAFCEMDSEYLLSVTDPAPEDMKVIDGSAPMPICIDHFRDLKDSMRYERRSVKQKTEGQS